MAPPVARIPPSHKSKACCILCTTSLQYPQGSGSDKHIRVVDKGAPYEVDDSTNDSGPKVCPVAFMPLLIENRGTVNNPYFGSAPLHCPTPSTLDRDWYNPDFRVCSFTLSDTFNLGYGLVLFVVEGENSSIVHKEDREAFRKLDDLRADGIISINLMRDELAT
jgi:hypothetical protein